MNLKQTDKEKIAKRRCESKGCPNRSRGIFKRKFLCKECYSKEHPTKIDKRNHYINYIRGL